MIIVLKPNTSKENVARVEELIKRKGLDTHVVNGAEMTVIGCIGDTTRVDPKIFEVDSSVDKVMHVQEPYKLANRAFHPEDSVVDVSGVKVGSGNMAFIAGPCSVETFDQVLEIAKSAKASGANLLRGGEMCIRDRLITVGSISGEKFRFTMPCIRENLRRSRTDVTARHIP